MSSLLDALRKSEARRRRGHAPAFPNAPASADDSYAGPESGEGVRRLVIALVLVVLLGAAVGGGLVLWNVAGEPESGPRAVATRPMALPPAPPGADRVPDRASERAPDGVSEKAAMRPADSGPPGTADGAGPSSEMPAAPGPEGAPRTPVPAASRSAALPTDPPSSEPRPVDAASAPPGADPAPEAGEDDWPDGAIRPWELPAAARAEFPEIDVTVHFYAPRPADRFVLIGGERYAEGDRIADGVRLERILRRGTLVGFRRYRIVIE